MKVYANEVSDFKITAEEILLKIGAPLPPLPRHRQAPPQGAPRTNFGEPAQAEPDGLDSGGEEELNGGGVEGGGDGTDGNGLDAEKTDLKTMVKKLQQKFFSDENLEEISSTLMAIIPMVGPEHSEKIAKVYAKFTEASAILKANLASLVVLGQPIQMMQNQVNQIMSPEVPGESGPAQQGLRIGPLTAILISFVSLASLMPLT